MGITVSVNVSTELLLILILFLLYLAKALLVAAESLLGQSLRINSAWLAFLWAYGIWIRFNPRNPVFLEMLECQLIVSCGWTLLVLLYARYLRGRGTLVRIRRFLQNVRHNLHRG
jgi:hypothetical protein